MILFVLFSQEQDQSHVYCGKIHSFLTLCLRKSVKKCLWKSLPLTPLLLMASLPPPLSGGTGRGQREGHTILSIALQLTAEARRSTRVQSCMHLAYGTMGAELAFLVACWFSYYEPEKQRGTRAVSPRGRKVWGSKPLPVALWERKQALRVEGGAGRWQRRGLGDSSEAEPAWSSWVPFLLSSSPALEGFRAPFYSHTLETHMCV